MRKYMKVFVSAVIVVSICLGISVSTAEASAEPALSIQMGAPFCDNAIIQRDMDVPVWGWSKPGDTITVTFAGQKKSAKADEFGKWMVRLDPMKASFEPRELRVSSAFRIPHSAITNVLVGEVWMASGQSNMQWLCGKSNCKVLAAELKADCEDKGMSVNPIREFRVEGVTSQLHPIEKAAGAWKDGDYEGYSAIAFAFAEKLYRELNVPIAILNCSFSQTAIEAWVPRAGWASAEDAHSKAINTLCQQTDPATPEHKEAWSAFYNSLEDQLAAAEAALKQGKKPQAISADVPGNIKGNRDATWLFNGLLNPVIPYAIRGAIWNQGYANMNKGISYYNNLHSLIRGWRIVWDRPELPVYFHQFYTPGAPQRPDTGSTSEMRLGTWMARDIPHTGMASQIDIGGAIHYQNKVVPGRRLALHALKNQYGKEVVADGPMFKSYEVKGDQVIVAFDHARGGLVVADTSFNRSGEEGATGFADPKMIENGEEKVDLFWLADEDRVWHPATFEIDGDTVIVRSEAVKKPRGISYGSGGIGFSPCLYNKALLPMTPFIQYDNEMVTSATWPDAGLKIAGATADPNSGGLQHEYRKMPILGVQFRDNAILQADKPVTIFGSTRKLGQWTDTEEEGDCKIHFAFDDIKQTIPVEKGMEEWSVTLPPMKADGKPHTLKAAFTIDGEVIHERVSTNILFGDVWYVAAPDAINPPRRKRGEVAPIVAEYTGPVVKMLSANQKRDGNSWPRRYSICVSTQPYNRFAAHWKPAEGVAARIGRGIAVKTGRPVGIIWMCTQPGAKGVGDRTQISHWIAPDFLKNAPSMMEDYKTVGSQYPGNPYYLENVRRYMADWKEFWGEYIPEMIASKAVPEGSRWSASWGRYPSSQPDIGDSKATQVYNIYVHPFADTVLKGIIFLTSESMIREAEGADFGSEMTALAMCFKDKFRDEDAEFIYTVPSKVLAAKITNPKKIEDKSTAVEIADWAELDKVIDAALK